MKTILLSFLLALPIISLAGKTYTLTVTVNQLDGIKPLAGITVQFYNKNHVIMALGSTDEEGKITFLKCTDKSFELICSSPDMDFEESKESCYNKELADIEKVIHLTYSGEKEREFIQSKTTLAQLDSTYLLSDSCQMNFTEAAFPGGNAEWTKFLKKYMKIPPVASEQLLDGKVYLSFAIDQNGMISGITVTRGIKNCPECDLEAVRLMAYMPAWTPATCNGKPVIIWYSIPMRFHSQ